MSLQKDSRKLARTLLLTSLVLAPIIGGGFDELPTALIELLVLASAAILIHREHKLHLPRLPSLVSGVVFFVLVCVSSLFTENWYATGKSLLYVSCLLLSYCAAVVLFKSDEWAAVAVWATVVTALGISLFGIRDYAIGTGGGAKFWNALVHGKELWRLFGTFVNPSFFAGYLVLTIPTSLGAYLCSARLVGSFIAGLGVVLELAALLLTGTKLAALALAVAMLIMFTLIFIRRLLDKRRLVRLIIIAVILVPCIVVFSAPLEERVREAEAGGAQVHSTKFRLYVWRSTLEMIRDHPLVGLGPGTFEFAYPRYAIAGPTKHAHQLYLQVGAEVGLPALVMFIIALLAIVKGYFDTLRHDRVGVDLEQQSKANKSNQPIGCVYGFAEWRLLECGLFSAFVGCCVRNLADSDWLSIGIALPTAIMTGLLGRRSGKMYPNLSFGRQIRGIALGIILIFALMAVSIGLGDYEAPDEQVTIYPTADVKSWRDRYHWAVLVNPLNPQFRREYAKCLVLADASDAQLAEKQLAVAIRIAPTDAANYFVRGLLAQFTGNPREAIRWFKQALRFNPNSTQIVCQLALTYKKLDDTKGYESALRRLIEIEKSDYERVKGVPELVDINYVYAHMYFGEKFLSERKYAQAAAEFRAAVDRLERWRSQKSIIRMQRALGMLTERDEKKVLQHLYEAYLRLSNAYRLLGKPKLAQWAAHKAHSLQPW